MGHRNQRRADSRFGVLQAALRPGSPADPQGRREPRLGEIHPGEPRLGLGEIR